MGLHGCFYKQQEPHYLGSILGPPNFAKLPHVGRTRRISATSFCFWCCFPSALSVRLLCSLPLEVKVSSHIFLSRRVLSLDGCASVLVHPQRGCSTNPRPQKETPMFFGLSSRYACDICVASDAICSAISMYAVMNPSRTKVNLDRDLRLHFII